jgi:chloramphenicol 3-O-phosphotransferase
MDLNKFSPEKLQEIATRNGITVEELLARGNKGKQNDSMETDPPTSQNTETSAGESSSGDISLGSPVISIEDFFDEDGKYLDEEDVSTALNSKLAKYGVTVESDILGSDAVKFRNMEDKYKESASYSYKGLLGAKSKDELAKMVALMNRDLFTVGEENYLSKVQERSTGLHEEYKQSVKADDIPENESIDLAKETKLDRFEAFEKAGKAGNEILFDSQEDKDDYEEWINTGVVPEPREEEIRGLEQTIKSKQRNDRSDEFVFDLNQVQRNDIFVLEQIRVEDITKKREAFPADLDNFNKNKATYEAEVERYNAGGVYNESTEARLQDIQKGLLLDYSNLNAIGEELQDSEIAPNGLQQLSAYYGMGAGLINTSKSIGLGILKGIVEIGNFVAAGQYVAAVAPSLDSEEELDEAFFDILEQSNARTAKAFLGANLDLEKEAAKLVQRPEFSEIENFKDARRWGAGVVAQGLPSMAVSRAGAVAMPAYFLMGAGGKSLERDKEKYYAYEQLTANTKILEDGGYTDKAGNFIAIDEFEARKLEAQNTESKRLLDIPIGKEYTSMALAGATEVVFEGLFDKMLTDGLLRALKEAPTEGMKSAAGNFIKSALKNMPAEGGSEGATQFANNYFDQLLLGKDVNLFEGVTEATAGGTLMGAGFSSVPSLAGFNQAIVNELATRQEKRELKELESKIESLSGVGALDPLDPSKRRKKQDAETEALIQELTLERDDITRNISRRLGTDLSIADAKAVGEINREIRKLNEKAYKIGYGNTSNKQKLKSQEIISQKLDNLLQQREDILTDKARSGAAKKHNASLKIHQDALDGYRQISVAIATDKGRQQRAKFFQQPRKLKQEAFKIAKEQLESEGEDTRRNSVEHRASENYRIEENKRELKASAENVKAFVEQSGLSEQLSIDATDSLEEAIAWVEKNVADKDKKETIEKLKSGQLNAVIADGSFMVNMTNAAKNNAVGAFAHELLHAVTRSKLKDQKSLNEAGGKLLEYLQQAHPELAAKVSLATQGYFEENRKEAFEELMNALSDALAEGYQYNESLLQTVKRFINTALKGTDLEISSEGQDIFYFIRDFNKKAHVGKKGKNAKYKLSSFSDDDKTKMSMSAQADKAKQVLEKVSANMDFFDPNSPLIARVLPGMIQAQLAKLSAKGLQFDMDEANSDIIYRLYSNGDINKFDGRGTLYGYINGRISFRIKDMLKASGEGKNDIVEDFNQSDIEDLKGAAADVTTTEQIEERAANEKPEYRPLLNSRIAQPELIENILAKIPRIVGTLKSRIDAPISKNTTVTPLVNELRLALGKQVDIDLKKAMGGKKDGVLRRFLTNNKKAILENMTTTYLMSAFPAAVQKQVNGVFTSDWKGKKIDRETTNTDKAGRTSGAELVRRLPNASTKIDDKTFLSFILDEKGNPLRGKKESLAKAIGEELAIEIVNQEMQDPDSPIRQAFEANQERLGTEIVDNYVAKLKLDFERGNVKYSMSNGFTQTELQSAVNTSALDIVLNKIVRSDKVFPNDYAQDNENFSPDVIKQFKKEAKEQGVNIDNVDFKKLFWHAGQILNSPAVNDKLLKDARFSNLIPLASKEVQEGLKDYMSAGRLKSTGQLEDLKAHRKATGLIKSRINPNELKALNSKAFAESIQPEVIVAESKLKRQDLSNVTKYNSQETSTKTLFELQKRGDLNNTMQSTDMVGQLQAQNSANRKLSSRIVGELILGVQTGEISLMDMARFLQEDSSRTSGLGPLGQLTIIDGNVDPNSKQYIEHVYPHVQFLFELLEIAANPNLSTHNGELSKETINAINKAYDKNILMSTDNLTAKPVLDKVLGPTNASSIERLRLYGEAARDNTYFAAVNEEGNLITLTEHFESLTEAEAIAEQLSINFEAVNSFQGWLQTSTKFSMSTPVAVFMVGGPGSGKSSTLKSLGLIDKGFRLVNQDPYLEKYIKDAGLASDEKTYNKEERSLRAKLGWKARKAAEEDLANNTAARESMVVDGTGASYKATTKKMKALEAAGFEIHMVHVNTSKDVAVQRNRARAERSLADFIVTKTWDSVQESAKQYKEDYAGRFYEVNTDNLSYGEALPEAFVNQVITGLEASGVKFSQGLSEELNGMVERTKGVAADKMYSKAQARMMGEGKGKYRLFVPASAEDFRGLTSYTFAGKGKQGEADQKFIEDNLITPYTRGIAMIEAIKQQVRRELNALRKADKKLFKMLGKKITNSDYTYDHALRVYMWTQQGIEIPNMNKDDIRFLVNAINAMPQLIELGNAMQLVSRQDTWMEPGDHWLSRTLVSDLNGMTERVGRKKYLQEFIENSQVIFSPENLNKIEAIYGTRHREAIEDSLFAMTNGTNRTTGPNKQVNSWLNWVNNSTGAIMFFNRRSAILQTLSSTNFINWSDNNPLKVAAAFANQPQYWSDFAMIFNSDKLKQRRSGLQTDVNQAEIANEARGAKNKAGAVIAYLLKIGFTPTQIADSFAIAAGGSSFYRNRVNTYLKDGMKQKDAEKQAFEDFSKTADEAQQSSDPYLVSQEQRSVLGRLVLAFQNTPMQYTRLMKKSMQDLANGRGDAKTHISKIIYYGAVQNFIFSALQSALFAVIPGFDDEEESEMTEKELEKLERKNDQRTLRIINSMTDSVLKGSGVRGAVIATLKNTITEYFKQEEKGFTADHTYTILQALSLSPPIGSKARKLYSAIQTKKFERDVLTARGFDVTADGKLNLGPAYSIIGSLASATVNLPLDRVVDELNSIVEALDSRNTTWQRIALALGWKTWDVGAKNEENDLIKTEAKAKRKEEGKAKAKKTRSVNKKKKKQDATTSALEDFYRRHPELRPK